MPKKSLPDTKPRPGVNTRLRTSLREKLEAAAAENNRTLGNEIETRLEASFGSDLGALIQKAVADGIAAHEAAKREQFLRGTYVNSDGSWAAASQGHGLAYGNALAQNQACDQYRY